MKRHHGAKCGCDHLEELRKLRRLLRVHVQLVEEYRTLVGDWQERYRDCHINEARHHNKIKRLTGRLEKCRDEHRG